MVSLVGRVPMRGELISHPAGLEFEVIDSDPRRVKKVRIAGLLDRPQAPAKPPANPDDSSAE
jgi:CBS domain containing-hemolysin-like protein